MGFGGIIFSDKPKKNTPIWKYNMNIFCGDIQLDIPPSDTKKTGYMSLTK
jgi:hypothetical protein